jgi:hypothetical protein
MRQNYAGDDDDEDAEMADAEDDDEDSGLDEYVLLSFKLCALLTTHQVF